MRTQRTQTDPLLLPLHSPSRKNSQKMVWDPSKFDIQVFGFLFLAVILHCCYCYLAAFVVWKQRVAAVRVRNGIAEENKQD